MKHYIHIVFLLIGIQLSAQKILVKDPSFAQAICTQYPALMDASCTLLDTSLAEKQYGTLDISNSSSIDVSELLYFNRIDSLKASGNNLPFFLPAIQPAIYWNLVSVDLSNNGMLSFPIFSVSTSFKLIKYFHLQNNKATIFQKLWAARDSIRVLDLSNNFLTDVEDYSQALKAKKIDLSNNYLTFQDLVPQTKHINFSTVFTVAPQRNIKWTEAIYNRIETDTFTLVIPVDKGVAGNTFKWFKDGNLAATTNTNKLFFKDLKIADGGTYTVEITNSNVLLADLKLYSESVVLEIGKCMNIVGLTVTQDPKCFGALVIFENQTSLGTTTPYQFYLVNYLKDTLLYTEKDNKVLTGDYQVIIKDSRKCIKTLNSTLKVQPLAGCDEFVLTPDGDGLQDIYYFKEAGKAQVYNQFGLLIRELQLPNFWDAKDASGNIVPPGKYVLIVNQTQKIELKILW